jgi:hypothetical protein
VQVIETPDFWGEGYVFHKERLFVFDFEKVKAVRAWPEPEALERVGKQPWLHDLFEGRLVEPARHVPQDHGSPASRRQLDLPIAMPPSRRQIARQRRDALASLRATIPSRLAALLEPFRSHQYAMLVMSSHSSLFIDLIDSNPVLAFHVANRMLKPFDPRNSQRLASRKQTELAYGLALPAATSSVRLIKKIDPAAASMQSLQQIHAALRNREIRGWLAHLPTIHTGVLELVGDEGLHRVLTSDLVHEVANSSRERLRAHTAEALRELLLLRRTIYGTQLPHPFKSRRRIEREREAILDAHTRCRKSGCLDLSFPAPPIPGTDDILPLSQPIDLVREGVRQRNCAASYASAVAEGFVYLYRVLRPQRATVALCYGPGDTWECTELRAACNEPVSPTTAWAVERWLRANRDAKTVRRPRRRKPKDRPLEDWEIPF